MATPARGCRSIGDTTRWLDEHPLRPPVGAADVLRWLLRHQRWSVVVGTVAATVWMGSAAAVPPLVGKAIDEGVATGRAGPLFAWLGVLALLGVVNIAAARVRHWHAYLLWDRSSVAVAHLVAARGLEPAGGVEGRVLPGEAVNHATSDARALGGPVDLMCRGTAAVVTFVAVAVAMLVTSPALGALVVAGLPPLLLLMVPLWRPLDRRAAAQQRALAAAADLAADSITGLATLKGLGAEAAAKARYRQGTRSARGAAMALSRLSAGWQAMGVLIPGAFLGGVAWLGGRLALDGQVTVGGLVAFFGYAAFLVQPVETFGEVGEVWAQGLASARRVAALLNLAPAVADAGQERPAATPSGRVELRGVRLVDRTTGRAVLEGFDLVLAPGERVGLACADGRAAAAVVDLLARDADPDAGAVHLDGRDVRTIPLARLRADVVVAHHDAFLFAGTLRENLLEGRPSATPAELRHALQVAAAEEIAGGAAEGLDVVVVERGRSLSGGQRQRAALARSLLTCPAVLVLHEPVSAVDAVTEQRVVERLVAERAGMTTLVVTRSPAVLAALDAAVLVAGGRVAAHGPHHRLLGEHDAYRETVLGDVARGFR